VQNGAATSKATLLPKKEVKVVIDTGVGSYTNSFLRISVGHVSIAPRCSSMYASRVDIIALKMEGEGLIRNTQNKEEVHLLLCINSFLTPAEE
jgi:hypothetical protein